MKRNTAAVVTTVSTAMLGAGWVAGMVGTALAANSGGVSIDALGSGNGVVGTTSGPTSSATASASPSASPSSGATASAAPDAAASAPAATTAAPPPAPAGPSGTFDGASVRTKFGSYQAELVIADGKITSISMLDSGASDGTSREISGYALPILIDSVLQNQTANVGYVSGASYTSQGFLTSVNDALVQAGLA